MKEVVVIILLLIGTLAQSQTEKIDSICNDYDELIVQAFEEGLDFYPAHITIKSILNKRAIGPVDHTIKLYFDEIEEFEEPIDEEEYYEPYKYAVLRKAIVIFESGSYLIESNFYFDENGFLIKSCFSEVGYECYQELVYFDEHNPVRITREEIKKAVCSDNDEAVAPYDKTELSTDEITEAKLLLPQAEEYRALLKHHYDIIKN